MKARCPSCEAAYRIDDAKIPEKGIHARCPKCQTRFFLKKEDSLQLDHSSQDNIVCPKCHHEQPHSESCIKCGIIYAKYEQNPQIDSAWENQAAAAMPVSGRASAVKVQDTHLMKSIRNACIAGIICGVLTLLVTLISAAGVAIPGLEFDLWNLLDVLLIFGLTYGIYNKNRVCAILMFVYFVGSKVLMWQETGSVKGLPIALLFGYYFLQGILGTFEYHRTHETTPTEFGVMKIVQILALVVIVAGVGMYLYANQYEKYNYEGADKPGYYYPDEVREEFLTGCKGGFASAVKKSKASIPQADIEKLCECFLGEFEDRFSFKEFNNKYGKSSALSSDRVPDEIKDLIETCIIRQGY